MDLKLGSTIHLIGICGTAMASLAGLLVQKGFKVTGSDHNPYPPMSTQIENLGIKLMSGYKAENLSHNPDFVIVGNVVSESNPEAQELIRKKIPFTSLPKAMGEYILKDKESIIISGTHGKTTTTSLMSWVCEICDLNPSFLIGGIPKNFTHSFRMTDTKYFVIEGDEYDTAYFDKVPKFIHYRPQNIILTSIEFDHADIYKDLDDVKKAFIKLLKLIPIGGNFIYHGQDQNIISILNQTNCKNIYSYGINSGADYVIKNIKSENNFTYFDIYFRNEKLDTFQTSMVGAFNILNSTSVIAMSHRLGFDMMKVKKAMVNFSGVKRRQEILGEPNGVLIIEDFAHHPTAVKETVLAIQKKYPSRKVFSVFEPRSATSRRKVFQQDYVNAFRVAHEVLLAKPYDQSKLDESNRFSTNELVRDLTLLGTKSHAFPSTDEIVSYLKSHAQKGDVILLMSNGGFDGIYQKLLKW